MKLSPKHSYRELLENIPGYFVGSNGVVYSMKSGKLRALGGAAHPVTGYQYVTLRKDGRNVPRSVHRLVLEAFVGTCPEGMEACHKNGVRTDNRLVNLRWGTRLENAADKHRHGTVPQGERHWSSKLTEQDVIAMRAAYATGETFSALARRYRISKVTARYACTGRTWKHIQTDN